MIVVRFTSGLGNQMYQYSFYELMKEKYGSENVKADITWFNANNDHHGYELENIFGNVKDSLFEVNHATFSDLFKVTGIIPNVYGRTFEKIRRYPNRIIREFTQNKRKPFIFDQLFGELSEEEFYNSVMNLDVSKDYYIMGFFTEQKYYRDRMDLVRKKLVFPEILNDSANIFLEDICGSESVSIHVRRGDYLSDTYKDQFISLGKEYYEDAVKYIKEKIDNPRFFIFSDDKEFIEKEFNWLENKCIVTGNDGNRSYLDMILMSRCKANIIANSTFSQWGSLLNNKEHITLYPRAYMKGTDNEVKTLPGWVMIG